MPKIGPNKVSIDPKAYAARVTNAKKRVAQIDPVVKAKIKEMYPNVTKAEAAKQALTTKKAAAKPMAKTAAKAPAKTTVKPKAPVKKKVVQMPSKISPSKMTPAQKAKYLQNPERYDG